MQDAAFGIESFAVAVARCRRVEALGQLVLAFGGAIRLVFEDNDGVLVEGIVDLCKVVV